LTEERAGKRADRINDAAECVEGRAASGLEGHQRRGVSGDGIGPLRHQATVAERDLRGEGIS
jgi:hypothetical protein